jgi:hypothetical protein
MTYPTVIPLRGMIEDHSIKFWWLGKWRPVRYYQKKQIPSAKVLAEAFRTFRLGAGLQADQKFEVLHWDII